MKKLFICISFILSFIPFAFWEVEGPFISQATQPRSFQEPIKPYPSLAFTKYIAHPEYKLNKYFPEAQRNTQYVVFLYNQNTNYLFSFTPTHQINTLKDNLLLLSNKNMDSSNREFFCTMKPLYISQNFSNTSSLRGGSINFSLFHSTPSLEKNFTPFSLSQKLTTDSGVKIKNPNFNELENTTSFPVLSKNGQKVSFQNALKKYFNKDNHYTAMATAITQSKYPDSNKSFVYEIGKAAHNITKIGEKEVERLNNSTILTIYSVLNYTTSKENQKKSSIIFGLAQDNTTSDKRKFFYVTDLENDISILLNQQ